VRRTLTIPLAAVALAAAAPLHAQRGADTPRRPALAAGADQNDPRAYLQLGTQLLTSRAGDAADAFYWAYQLDPTSADALYGRWAAFLISNPRRLLNYWNGDRRTARSPEVLAMDSLYFRALTMDPFLYRRFEMQVLRAYLRQAVRDDADLSAGHLPEAIIEREVNLMLHNAGPWWKAIEAYGQGRFQESLSHYNDALPRARSRSLVRAERGRLFAHVGNHPGALEEFGHALTEMRREDERDLVFLYESKALMEHGIAVLHERMGNRDAAREAYGRSLTEDLAFYPAHVRLGLMALAAGDTATAVSELDLAAQAAGADPSVHYTYGAMLAQLGRLDEAAVQLDRAADLAPYYADPHFALGVVRDGQGNLPGAQQAYRAFMERASRTHRRRTHAEQRLAALAAPAETTQTAVAP
jgi:tetratricopeptide (TPR) repeat protein